MLPLFIKDGLVVPYFALSFIFFLVTRLTASDHNNKERVPSLAKLVVCLSSRLALHGGDTHLKVILLLSHIRCLIDALICWWLILWVHVLITVRCLVAERPRLVGSSADRGAPAKISGLVATCYLRLLLLPFRALFSVLKCRIIAQLFEHYATVVTSHKQTVVVARRIASSRTDRDTGAPDTCAPVRGAESLAATAQESSITSKRSCACFAWRWLSGINVSVCDVRSEHVFVLHVWLCIYF